MPDSLLKSETETFIPVVKQIQQKTGLGNNFASPVFLGTEQRFVGALRNSHLNNLEEQLIIGTDKITETYEIIENGMRRYVTETKFYNGRKTNDGIENGEEKYTAPTEYYKLVTIDSEGFEDIKYYPEEYRLELKSISDSNYTGENDDTWSSGAGLLSFGTNEYEDVLFIRSNIVKNSIKRLYYHIAGRDFNNQDLETKKPDDELIIEKRIYSSTTAPDISGGVKTRTIERVTYNALTGYSTLNSDGEENLEDYTWNYHLEEIGVNQLT